MDNGKSSLIKLLDKLYYDIKLSLPILSSLKNYSNSSLKTDLFAGLTVGSVLIPQSMAYAMLAGMPPIYGLYASILPIVIYALFASSTKVSLGPVAISALLLFSGISAIAEPFSSEYITLVITAGLLIGAIQLMLGLLRLGFLVNLLSHPVISGFTSAAAIIIAVTQLPDALGLTTSNGPHPIENCKNIILALSDYHLWTVVVSSVSLIGMWSLKKWVPKLPYAFLIVILGIVLSYLLDFNGKGIEVIGEIPRGLPSIAIPHLDMTTIRLLLPTVLTVTVIGIVESLGIARALQVKHKDHIIRPDAELMALGISKIGGSLAQAIPTSASFSRSAINSASGAKTQIASLTAVLLVILTLLFLAPMIYFLPKPILSAIILLSVLNLFDIKEMKFLWKTNRSDFAMLMITFLATLVLGIENGVLLGVIMSLLYVLYRSSKPTVAELGKIPETIHYKNLTRYERAQTQDGYWFIRFENQLYFANSEYFRSHIYNKINADSSIRYIIIDSSIINSIDSTGIHMLNDLDKDLKKRNIELHLCGTIGSVRDSLHLAGLLHDEHKHHATINEAVRSIENPDSKFSSPNSLQTNIK